MKPIVEPLSRRQALGVLAAPLLAACFPDRLTAPLVSLSETAGPTTLIGAGDQHAVASNYAHTTGRIIKGMLDANPAAHAFALGDLVPNGTAQEYRDYYHRAWGAFKDRTLFMVGNHDRKADPTATAYYDYVGEAGGPRGKGYYAKTLGSWRCYFLNDQGGLALRSEQTEWLKADLPNWANHHIMAMWHQPMFASACNMGGKALTMTYPGALGPWWSALQSYGAELVVSGHVHRYERLARMLRDGTPSAQGIRQFIVGTGGVKPMEILKVHPQCQRQVVTRGIFRLDLYSDRYKWKLTDLAGVVRDSGWQMCRKVVAAG